MTQKSQVEVRRFYWRFTKDNKKKPAKKYINKFFATFVCIYFFGEWRERKPEMVQFFTNCPRSWFDFENFARCRSRVRLFFCDVNSCCYSDARFNILLLLLVDVPVVRCVAYIRKEAEKKETATVKLLLPSNTISMCAFLASCSRSWQRIFSLKFRCM